MRRSKKQEGSAQIANELRILEKARTFQEIELAVNTSDEEFKASQAAAKDAQLQAYYQDDLSLFPAEEIEKAKLNEGENLRGACEQESRASLTEEQLQHVIETTWSLRERPSQAGEASLKARLVDKGFKHQSLDLDMDTHASAPSHMSLKILLTLSLINKWDVVTADISSGLLQAPIASDELVLVKPPPELEQNPDVLWKLTRAVHGFTWPVKLEELRLRKNKVDPCIFTS